jgi:hypothetical protein
MANTLDAPEGHTEEQLKSIKAPKSSGAVHEAGGTHLLSSHQVGFETCSWPAQVCTGRQCALSHSMWPTDTLETVCTSA